MPIPLGVLAVAGAGGGAAAGNAYEWLETTILSSNQATVTFSNLNSTYGSTYQHLQIRAVARSSQAQTFAGITVTFNGDTGANYVTHEQYGNGLNVVSAAILNQTGILADQHEIPGASATANAFGAVIYDILDPFETTKFKTVRFFGGRGPITDDHKVLLASGLWRNTNAVTSIGLAANGNFVTGSRFSLYGLRSA